MAESLTVAVFMFKKCARQFQVKWRLCSGSSGSSGRDSGGVDVKSKMIVVVVIVMVIKLS